MVALLERPETRWKNTQAREEKLVRAFLHHNEVRGGPGPGESSVSFYSVHCASGSYGMVIMSTYRRQDTTWEFSYILCTMIGGMIGIQDWYIIGGMAYMEDIQIGGIHDDFTTAESRAQLTLKLMKFTRHEEFEISRGTPVAKVVRKAEPGGSPHGESLNETNGKNRRLCVGWKI